MSGNGPSGPFVAEREPSSGCGRRRRAPSRCACAASSTSSERWAPASGPPSCPRGRPLPDPCSRSQPDGIRGESEVVAAPRGEPGPSPRLDELVLYELHVGAFSAEGTFDGVAPYLRELRELGVTAIELMPVATFPGERGWGYDGLYAYAPHPAYGGPEGLARLVR